MKKESKQLLDRITAIINNPNFKEFVEVTKEFEHAKARLQEMDLFNITDYSLDYVAKIEKHLKNIQPHYQMVTINGELQRARFSTKT